MKDKITKLANDLEEDNVNEKFFEDLVEIFNSNVSSLYLCKLQKISGLQTKKLFFINNGLNIMCATGKLEKFSFVCLDDLKEQLNFNFNLSKWKLQGPDERLPTIYQNGRINKIENKLKVTQELNLDSVFRPSSNFYPNKKSEFLDVKKNDDIEESFVDEERYDSAKRRMNNINQLNDNMESNFKLSENKRKSKFKNKKDSDIMDMQLKNQDLNGFSEFRISDI